MCWVLLEIFSTAGRFRGEDLGVKQITGSYYGQGSGAFACLPPREIVNQCCRLRPM